GTHRGGDHPKKPKNFGRLPKTTPLPYNVLERLFTIRCPDDTRKTRETIMKYVSKWSHILKIIWIKSKINTWTGVLGRIHWRGLWECLRMIAHAFGLVERVQ
ncbi:hypothetical protein L0244_38765, partial [bacterium]|nr:hypothetical protein [bacterium]